MHKKKIFHDLSKEEQNNIRREYKEKCSRDYNYSIRLYILYVILGIITLLGTIIALYLDVMIGSLIFLLGFIFMIIVIYFLDLSNNKFYRFLKRKGFKYDKRGK